jgi:hypothetical protein
LPPTARARPPESSIARTLIAFAACMLALNILFQVPALVSAGGVLALLLPSADALLLAVLACGYAWLRLPGLRPFTFVLAVIALLFLAFRTADSLVPYYFDRAFRPVLDLGYLPDLYALLRDTMSFAHFYGGLLLLVATAAGLAAGLICLFGVLARSCRLPACRWFLVAVAALLAAADLVTPLAFIRDSVPVRAAEEIGGASGNTPGAGTLNGGGVDSGPEKTVLREESAEPATGGGLLALLGGRNFLLLVVESYGYTLFSEPEHFNLIREPLGRFEAELTAGGFSICSAFLESTAFGGNSWLADATLTTGVRVADEAAYRKLLASEVKPMAAYFREAGYRAVAAMPATTSAWPEGEFFAFDRIYIYPDFGYRGPNLKWAPMTDQYVLDFIQRAEIAGAASPLFVEYLLISSHYPFNLIPVYFEDWSLIGDGSIYHRPESVRVLPIRTGRQTAGAAGLAEAIAYELKLIAGYLRQFVSDESLVVIVGDHQPFSGITGRNKPRSVAIHVASRRAELLSPFLRRGYVPGAFPSQFLPHFGMETFLPALLQDFSVGGAETPPAGPAAGG